MFLTRSIRRKMVCGLVLVLLMLIAVSLSGIYAQNCYRDVVAELDRAVHHTPRRADLVAAIALLLEPLQLNLNGSPAAQQFQQQQFGDRLQRAQSGVDAFHRKLDRLPPSRGVQARQPVTMALLGQIKDHLRSLEQPTDTWNARQIQNRVNHLQALALQIPDPKEGQTAAHEQKLMIYRTLKSLNTVMISVVVVLFLGLAIGSYGLIFAPLRRLYQGTARVAQGDFDYRVAIDTHDEVGQLAASFNKMTDRFQEIKRNLDRQVAERSRQLVRSERLADVGFLSAGVA
ncbi:MAG: HAMP domain-containing protein, partial [Planctomycetaceae bacterium]